MKKDEFDQAFERYLKERFKPFRDKERPADYGRDLVAEPREDRTSPKRCRSPRRRRAICMAVVTINRKDRELDIVLISAKDGSIVRNLTQRLRQGHGLRPHRPARRASHEMPWMSWSPKGDRLAYFVRTEKERTLIIQNVLTRKIEERIPMKIGRRARVAELLARWPHGGVLRAARRQSATSTRSISRRKQVTNLTTDDFADYAPSLLAGRQISSSTTRGSAATRSCSGSISTRKKKTQITFGTHDETAAQFIDDHTIVFSSTATDPAVPLEPEVAKNGNIYNIWTLDMRTGELRQYTDALGGNLSPVVLNEGADQPDRASSATTRASTASTPSSARSRCTRPPASDFGAPGPIIDFQAPLQHTLVADNERKKKPFEKMFLEGRPPVNVGVTSNGDVFGGTQISFGDVLGDKQFNVFAASISQYRTMAAVLRQPGAALPVRAAGLFADAVLLRPARRASSTTRRSAPFISRDLAQATRTVRGGSAFGIYPLNRYRRVEVRAASAT